MTDAILEITDGTTTISLINKSSGFHMIRWIPGITDYKGGGVFQNPPLADWRQLRVGKWDTVQEQFGLTVDAANPNGAAYMLQELRRLLEKANAYWTTDWQNTPVYLAAKAKCETETRYCLIVKGRLANDQNYYQQPFTGKRSTMQDLPLEIERRAWLENAPNDSTAIQISNEVEYDSISLGRAATTANEVYHSNYRSIANITNIHITTAGANIQDTAKPHTIIDVSGTNSTYFGIDTSVTDSGPFYNLIFDIGTAQVGASITWEYWNGAWVSLTPNDLTSQFTNTGVNNVSWVPLSDWIAASPGGALPVGYYVRARVTSTGSTNATQQNRNIYSQTVPYVQTEANQIPGDIPALARLTMQNMLYSVSTQITISRVVFGLRSNNRGISAFTPYINISDEQNPTGISVSAGNGAFVSGSNFPTGRASRITVGGAGSAESNIAIITLDSSIVDEYYGTYHAYLRYSTPSGFSLLEGKIQGKLGNTTFHDSEFQDMLSNAIVDLGVLPLLPSISRIDPGDITITVRMNYTATTATNITAIDLVLIPIDEWSAEFRVLFDDLFNRIVDASSLTNMKKMLEVSIRDNSNNEQLDIGSSVNNGPIILQANSQQRLYSLAWAISSLGVVTSGTTILKRGQVWRNGRYLSLRGER